MKTAKINLAKLRNEEHFQFQCEFRDLVNSFGAQALNIEAAFATYLILFERENEAFQVIRKSLTTDLLADADNERDTIFRGFADTISSAINHYSPEKRVVATRLTILFEQYGNVARKAYNEETASIGKLIYELQTNYDNDVSTLGLSEWVEELHSRNMAFEALMNDRYSEGATKTDLIMREVRLEIDVALRAITARLDALMLVYGIDLYEAFVRELNTRVEKYNHQHTQRMGRAAAHLAHAHAHTQTATSNN